LISVKPHQTLLLVFALNTATLILRTCIRENGELELGSEPSYLASNLSLCIVFQHLSFILLDVKIRKHKT
jgi:hypothetical protein